MDGSLPNDSLAVSIPGLAAEIAELAGHLNAATYHLIKLIAEFDRRSGRSEGEWTMDQGAAFLDTVNALRQLARPGNAAAPPGSSPAAKGAPAESQCRIKQTFDEIDRRDFGRAAFQAIHDYFHKAVREIDQTEGLRARFEDLGTRSFMCTALNPMSKRGVVHITVHLQSGLQAAFGEISYSFSENAPPNIANGWLSVEAGDFEMHLRASSFAQCGTADRATPDEAARQLWEQFVNQAVINS